MLQAPRSCGSEAGDSPQPSPALSSRLRPQRKTFRRRETRAKSRSVKKPTVTRSPATKRLEQYQAHTHTHRRVRCGYGQAPKGSTERQRMASPPAPSHKDPSLHFQQKTGRIFLANQAGSTEGQRSGRSHARIQMRSQDVPYYNPGAPLWRLRAGPFSLRAAAALLRCH